jgi:hypothetical protein
MEQKRTLPQSELDFHLMTTDSVWGRNDISPELKEKLTKYFCQKDDKGEIVLDKDNQPIITSQSYWNLLGFYTRDMRLANLSTWNGEVEYCQYFLNLANDFLQCELIEPFLISLSRVATMLEISQSKGGFLRKQMNTLRTENLQGEVEPPKKQLFG